MIVVCLQWELLEEGCNKNFGIGCNWCVFVFSFYLCAGDGIYFFFEWKCMRAWKKWMKLSLLVMQGLWWSVAKEHKKNSWHMWCRQKDKLLEKFVRLRIKIFLVLCVYMINYSLFFHYISFFIMYLTIEIGIWLVCDDNQRKVHNSSEELVWEWGM
jgi:hypothetical protein